MASSSASASFAAPPASTPPSDEIEPVECTARSLAGEFKAIGKILSDTSAVWTKRVSALHRVRGMVAGGGASIDCWRPAVESIKGALAAQLRDLRSRVAMEAAQTIQTLAGAMGDDFAVTAAAVVPAALRNVVVSKAAIAQPADECIRHIIEHTQLPSSAIDAICRGAAGKSAVGQTRCASYVLAMVRTYPPAVVADAAPALLAAAQACIAGRAPDARADGRAAFARLRDVCPDECAAVYRSLSANEQRRIDAAARGATVDELAASTVGPLAGGAASRPASARAAIRQQRRAAAAAAAASGGSGGDLVVELFAPPRRRAAPAVAVTADAAPADGGTALAASAPARVAGANENKPPTRVATTDATLAASGGGGVSGASQHAPLPATSVLGSSRAARVPAANANTGGAPPPPASKLPAPPAQRSPSPSKRTATSTSPSRLPVLSPRKKTGLRGGAPAAAAAGGSGGGDDDGAVSRGGGEKAAGRARAGRVAVPVQRTATAAAASSGELTLNDLQHSTKTTAIAATGAAERTGDAATTATTAPAPAPAVDVDALDLAALLGSSALGERARALLTQFQAVCADNGGGSGKAKAKKKAARRRAMPKGFGEGAENAAEPPPPPATAAAAAAAAVAEAQQTGAPKRKRALRTLNV